MLTDKMKQEMLEDARSETRRKNFAAARALQEKHRTTLDQYIVFLNGIQKVFGPFPAREPRIFTNCKL